MISQHAIRLATEYLDYSFKKNEQATLVGMLIHVDYYERVVLLLEEVNEALNQRPSVVAHRINGKIIFSSTDGDKAITAEDLDQGIADYHIWFEAEYKKLQARKE